MVNRDWVQLAELYKRMGFIPTDVDTAPIVVALENALPDVRIMIVMMIMKIMMKMIIIIIMIVMIIVQYL
jgi:hypothetical protein